MFRTSPCDRLLDGRDAGGGGRGTTTCQGVPLAPGHEHATPPMAGEDATDVGVHVGEVTAVLDVVEVLVPTRDLLETLPADFVPQQHQEQDRQSLQRGYQTSPVLMQVTVEDFERRVDIGYSHRTRTPCFDDGRSTRAETTKTNCLLATVSSRGAHSGTFIPFASL